jgi:magnesium-transporting ATPase (P-type)
MKEADTKNCPAEYFRILDVLEFTSARKRMSVIVKDGASGKIRVITKGADSKVFDNLVPGEKNGKLHQRTKLHAAGFANDGLRTLGVGQRFVNQNVYDKWKKEIDALRLDPVQTKLKKKQLPNKIDDKAGEMEVGLSLLGATAIEDKLQVGVPDAIADLAKAGIKLWVLTGDKEDTAINIGFACKLLRDDMHEGKDVIAGFFFFSIVFQTLSYSLLFFFHISLCIFVKLLFVVNITMKQNVLLKVLVVIV